MTERSDFRVVFPGGEKAAGHARRVLTERLAGVLAAEPMDDLLLLVTEIVSNSVRHGRVGEDGEIDLCVRVLPTVVRVELRDTGIQVDPRVRTPDLRGGGGFGMVLVERMSERWGVDHEPAVVMWFELRRSGPAAPRDAAASAQRPAPSRRPTRSRRRRARRGQGGGPAGRRRQTLTRSR